VVYKPKRMSVEELQNGYAWAYRTLFSHRSIWRRRPAQVSAVLPYLAMCYLYKKSNRFWHFLIKHNLTASVWRPLVEWTRLRHVRFRKKLMTMKNETAEVAPMVVSAGV